MKSRIIRVLLVLTLFLGGCHTTRKITTSTITKDSTTTITARPVQLQIKPDTASNEYSLDAFLAKFQAAAPGQEIDHQEGQGKQIEYRIVKTTGRGFGIQAQTRGKDTTIYVHDTITIIREKRVTDTLRTQVEKPGLFGEWKTKFGYLSFGLILALLLFLAWQVERLINKQD